MSFTGRAERLFSWVTFGIATTMLGGCSIQDGVSSYPPGWPARVSGHTDGCSWIDKEFVDKGIYDLRGFDYSAPGWVTTAYGLFFWDAGFLPPSEDHIANFADSVRLHWDAKQGFQITAMLAGTEVASRVVPARKVGCNKGIVTPQNQSSLSGGDFELIGIDREVVTLELASDGSLIVHTIFRRYSIQLFVVPLRERGDSWYRFEPVPAEPLPIPAEPAADHPSLPGS